jgi:hypothetical protein
VNVPPVPPIPDPAPTAPQPTKPQPVPERRCQGTSRGGQPCRAIPPHGDAYCRQHTPADPDPGSGSQDDHDGDGEGEHGGQQDSQQDQGSRRSPSQATLLVETAEQVGIQLFHTDTHDAYAIIIITDTAGGHRETWPVKAKPFRRWLQRLFYERHGKAPGAQAVQDAIGVLEGNALFEAAEQPIAVRVAAHQGAIWLDLANDRWEAIEITPTGWRLVADPPVRFRRPDSSKPLPPPNPAGTSASCGSSATSTTTTGPWSPGSWSPPCAPPGPTRS